MARRLAAFPVRAAVAAWWCLTVFLGTAAPRGVAAVEKATPELQDMVVDISKREMIPGGLDEGLNPALESYYMKEAFGKDELSQKGELGDISRLTQYENIESLLDVGVPHTAFDVSPLQRKMMTAYLHGGFTVSSGMVNGAQSANNLILKVDTTLDNAMSFEGDANKLGFKVFGKGNALDESFKIGGASFENCIVKGNWYVHQCDTRSPMLGDVTCGCQEGELVQLKWDFRAEVFGLDTTKENQLACHTKLLEQTKESRREALQSLSSAMEETFEVKECGIVNRTDYVRLSTPAVTTGRNRCGEDKANIERDMFSTILMEMDGTSQNTASDTMRVTNASNSSNSSNATQVPTTAPTSAPTAAPTEPAAVYSTTELIKTPTRTPDEWTVQHEVAKAPQGYRIVKTGNVTDGSFGYCHVIGQYSIFACEMKDVNGRKCRCDGGWVTSKYVITAEGAAEAQPRWQQKKCLKEYIAVNALLAKHLMEDYVSAIGDKIASGCGIVNAVGPSQLKQELQATANEAAGITGKRARSDGLVPRPGGYDDGDDNSLTHEELLKIDDAAEKRKMANDKPEEKYAQYRREEAQINAAMIVDGQDNGGNTVHGTSHPDGNVAIDLDSMADTGIIHSTTPEDDVKQDVVDENADLPEMTPLPGNS